jgi:hypothetical protein
MSYQYFSMENGVLGFYVELSWSVNGFSYSFSMAVSLPVGC